MPKVIITGGTGLIGRNLTEFLRNQGYEVAVLTRDPRRNGEYKWDIRKQYIDPEIFNKTQAIIHLAGADVADKPWTASRKQEILDSRTQTAAMLLDHVKDHPHTIRTFISASAVGYYGDGKSQVLTEDSPSGSGFLSEVCRQWEPAAGAFSAIGIRVCKLRIGFVLSPDGGALPKMDLPNRFGLGTYFGSGTQFISWIHIKDLCWIFQHVLENEQLHGAYNACAPNPVNNLQMTKDISAAWNKPFLPLPAPEFILRALLGERAELLLMSSRCSTDKIHQAGFRFLFSELPSALQDIYQNK